MSSSFCEYTANDASPPPGSSASLTRSAISTANIQLTGQERDLHRQITSHPDFLWVSASDDSACWLTHLQGPMSAEELLGFTDAHTSEPMTFPSHKIIVGAGLLPFLVRKMLVELGYAVPGVERMTASG